MPSECLFRLPHQIYTVGEKKNIGYIVVRQEYVDERNNCPSLARSGSHYPQNLSLVVAIFIASPLDGNFLIGAIADVVIDRELTEWLFLISAIHDAFHIPLGEYGINLAGGIVRVVPKPCGITVGIKDQRALPRHLLQTIGIESGLLSAYLGINPRFFSFHYG